MDNEAKERRRKLNAARMRERRALEREARKDEPKKLRGGQPTENPRFGHTIYLTEAEWAFCMAQTSSGSEFVRQLVADYREFVEKGTLPSWLRKEAADDEEEGES